MNSASEKPDLRAIGERAFTEVLTTLLSLPATVSESAVDRPPSTPADEITSRVLFSGPRVSGRVQIRLPQAFVASAARRLCGAENSDPLAGHAGNNTELQDDTAGELANMVAGQVARQLAAAGYSAQLGTPSLSRGAHGPPKAPTIWPEGAPY